MTMTYAALDPNTTHTGMDMTTIKMVLAVTIFILGLLSVLAPQRLVAAEGAQHWFSLGNMAASGVLLSGGLVHMLADSGEVLNEGEFPMANFIAGLTFIGFMVLEESMHLIFMTSDAGEDDEEGGLLSDIVMISHDHGHNSHGDNHSHNHQDHPEKENNHSDDHHDHSHEKQALLQHSSSNLSNSHHHHNHGSTVELPRTTSRRHRSSSRRKSACGGCVGHSFTYEIRPDLQLMTDHTDAAVHARLSHGSNARLSLLSDTPEHHHHHDDHLELHLHGSAIAAGILMVALSIHSILAGISIGIENETETIEATAFAILAHKSFEGFCLGSSLVNAQIRNGRVYWSLSLGFALATPIGIVVGLGVLENSGNPTAIALVQAMCAGTFLYIAIVEIGGKELLACRHDEGEHGSKWQKQIDVLKLICFVGGYLMMSALALFV